MFLDGELRNELFLVLLLLCGVILKVCMRVTQKVPLPYGHGSDFMRIVL